jgi:hypothetical protein
VSTASFRSVGALSMRGLGMLGPIMMGVFWHGFCGVRAAEKQRIYGNGARTVFGTSSVSDCQAPAAPKRYSCHCVHPSRFFGAAVDGFAISYSQGTRKSMVESMRSSGNTRSNEKVRFKPGTPPHPDVNVRLAAAIGPPHVDRRLAVQSWCTGLSHPGGR